MFDVGRLGFLFMVISDVIEMYHDVFLLLSFARDSSILSVSLHTILVSESPNGAGIETDTESIIFLENSFLPFQLPAGT